ncbi:unnamed protein product, partial [Sphacelaria rigidula]
WRLTERQLLSLSRHHMTPLLDNLRLLVVAFDNMREKDRVHIATVGEIVNNRDWLLRLATICTSAERCLASRHNRSAPAPRSSTLFHGAMNDLSTDIGGANNIGGTRSISRGDATGSEGGFSKSAPSANGEGTSAGADPGSGGSKKIKAHDRHESTGLTESTRSLAPPPTPDGETWGVESACSSAVSVFSASTSR